MRRQWYTVGLLSWWTVARISAWPTQWPLLEAASSSSPRSKTTTTTTTTTTLISDDQADVYEAGWYDPRARGGSMLDRVYEWGVHEPLNVIISNRSSPDVLRESGFIAYTRSLGFWQECASLHLGDAQYANLGDGNVAPAGIATDARMPRADVDHDDNADDGVVQAAESTEGTLVTRDSGRDSDHFYVPELFEMRESWWPFIGSCLESVIGGNHFRAWKQNGTWANSGAWFLAVSIEVDVRSSHKIDVDGYNRGRDALVERAIRPGGTRFRKRKWTTTVEWVEGLLEPGKDGINHGIAQDGRVAVLTAVEY